MKLGISFMKDPLSLMQKSSSSLFFVFHLTGEKNAKDNKKRVSNRERRDFLKSCQLQCICTHDMCLLTIQHSYNASPFFFIHITILHLISTQNNLCTVYDMLPQLMKGEKKTENAREQGGKFHILKRTIQHLHDANQSSSGTNGLLLCSHLHLQ